MSHQHNPQGDARTGSPSADLIQRLKARVYGLVNRGAEICPSFQPRKHDDGGASALCDACGYGADVHTLRDCLDALASAPRPQRETLQGVIDARCHCQQCCGRTGDIYRQVSGRCRNCGAGPFLMLYRAGDPAAAQDCPRCKGGYKPVSAERPATDDEIPVAADPRAVPLETPSGGTSWAEIPAGTQLPDGGVVPAPPSSVGASSTTTTVCDRINRVAVRQEQPPARQDGQTP